MSFYDYAFFGVLTAHKLGAYTYKVIRLPAELREKPPFAGQNRLRFEGELGDLPLSGAWQSDGQGGLYAMVSPKLMKALGIALGAELELRFNLVSENEIELSEELADALEADEAAAEAWAALTPGRQRGLAYLVASAKTEPTRRKRVALVVAGLHSGDLPGPPGRKRQS